MDDVITREVELRRLMAAFARARSGEGGVVLVEGHAGMGKSTLLDAFRQEIASIDPGDVDGGTPSGVATGTCFEMAGGQDSFEPFKELLRALVSPRQRPGLGPLVLRLVKETAPDLLTMVPGLGVAGAVAKVGVTSAAVIGEWSMSADEQTRADLSESVAHQYVETFTALADSLAPLVLIIDDGHWIDRASAQLLYRLAKSSRDSGLLLVLGFRPVTGQESALASVLRELMILNATEVIPLGGFTDREVSQYLSRRYGTTAYDPRLVAWVRQLSDGSPMFVAQYMSLLEEEGLLRRTTQGLVVDHLPPHSSDGWRGGDVDELPMPRSVKELLGQRIENLADRERRLLELGSVQGIRFMSAVLTAMASVADEELLRELRRLERVDQVIREEEPERWARRVTGTYAFQHSLLRQAFYSELGRHERQSHHALAARALIEMLTTLRAEGEQPRRLLLEIVHHLRASGEPHEAARFGVEVARTCYAEGAFGEVAALSRGVLEDLAQPGGPPEADLLHAEAIRMLLATSEPQWFVDRGASTMKDLVADARAAAHRAGDRHLEAQLLFLSGRSQVVSGGLRDAVDTLDEARQAMHDLGDVFGELSCMIEVGHHQIALDPDTAMLMLRQAQHLLEERAETLTAKMPAAAVARISHRLDGTIGVAAFDHGRYGEALADLQDAVDGFVAGRMTDLYLLHANFLGQALVATGQYERAETLLLESVDAGARDPAGVIVTAYNRALLGKLYVEWGRIEDATTPLAAAWAQIQRTPDNSILPLIANYYAELLLARRAPTDTDGRVSDVAGVLELSIAHSRAHGFERSVITALALRARLALDVDDLPTALKTSGRAAAALWDARVMPAVRAEEIYLIRAQVLEAAGLSDESGSWWARAREVLNAKAATLPERAVRAQFLERVEVSRTILQATEGAGP